MVFHLRSAMTTINDTVVVTFFLGVIRVIILQFGKLVPHYGANIFFGGPMEVWDRVVIGVGVVTLAIVFGLFGLGEFT